MKTTLATIAAALVFLAPPVTGQPGGAPPRTPPPTPDRMVLQQRRQETVQSLQELTNQVRKMNEAMQRDKVPQSYQRMGAQMQEACARLGDVQRLMAVHESKLEGDVKPGRLEAIDRVEERFRVMAREMEEAQHTLRYLATMKERKCDPLPADEAEMVRARNQELAEHVVRVNERLRSLGEWSDATDAPVNARETVRTMAQLQERLRTMAEACDNMRNDSTLNGDRERLREMDRLHDRLHVTLREMEESAEALPQAFE
ncbi:MAG: hypothetical protein ACM3JJ_03745 [Hyphomicrobiales bacterium]